MSSSRAAIFLVALCATTAIGDSYIPKANTRREIKKYVRAAAKHIAEHGPSCAEFAKPEWRSGDYYIFVLGPDKRSLCHPDASVIGKRPTEVHGERVGGQILAAAKKFRGGWVDYAWPRPGTTKPMPKSTYVMHVKSPAGDTYIVGSGGYGLR